MVGSEVVLSYQARTTSGTLTMGHTFSTPSGVDGWSGAPATCSGNCPANTTLTTSWQPFSVTFTVPSTGSNGLAVSFVPQAAGTFELSQVQLELGSAATMFEFRDVGTERQRCLGYWQQGYDDGVAAGTVLFNEGAAAVVGVGTYAYFTWDLGTPMREPSTVTIYNPNTGRRTWSRRTAGAPRSRWPAASPTDGTSRPRA